MKHLEKLSRKQLGEVLVDEGMISGEQLAEAMEERGRSGKSLGSILVAAKFLTEWDLAKMVCTHYQLPFLQLKSVSVSKTVIELFTHDEYRSIRFFPLDEMGTVVTLAVSEMPEYEQLEGIHKRTGLTPFLFVSVLSEIQKSLEDEAGVAVEQAQSADRSEVADDVGQEELDPQAEAMAALEQALSEQDGTAEVEFGVDDEQEGVLPADSGGDWANLFDSANESVLKEIDRE
jgi:type IV pilus assembly protein PilB